MSEPILTPDTPRRWLRVGRSGADVPAEAGREAAALALDGGTPALVVVFSSPFLDLAEVAAGVRAAAGDGVPVVGCTTSGELAGLEVGSGSVVVVALGGPGLTVRTARGSLADGPRAAGIAAAAGIEAIDAPHRLLLMLTEGLAGDRAEIVRGAYSVAGAGVPLVGGCAGDELEMRRTLQLYGDEVLTGAVIGAAIGSEAPIGVGIGHGWRRIGEPIVVTASNGDRILRLDDEPALDYYLTRLGAPPEAFDDQATWQQRSLLHPLGLPRPGGEEVRAILGVDFADRSLFCGDVPQGTMIWIMEGDADTVLAGTGVACDEALAMLGDRPPVGLIAFDCTARRGILGEEGVRREVQEIAARAPGAPVGGFYTYGEIARTRGSRGVHNATLVMLALA